MIPTSDLRIRKEAVSIPLKVLLLLSTAVRAVDLNLKLWCMNKLIYKLPHGYFKGFFYMDYSPALTISSWEYNNFVIEYERDSDCSV